MFLWIFNNSLWIVWRRKYDHNILCKHKVSIVTKRIRVQCDDCCVEELHSLSPHTLLSMCSVLTQCIFLESYSYEILNSWMRTWTPYLRLSLSERMVSPISRYTWPPRPQGYYKPPFVVVWPWVSSRPLKTWAISCKGSTCMSGLPHLNRNPRRAAFIRSIFWNKTQSCWTTLYLLTRAYDL